MLFCAVVYFLFPSLVSIISISDKVCLPSPLFLVFLLFSFNDFSLIILTPPPLYVISFETPSCRVVVGCADLTLASPPPGNRGSVRGEGRMKG